MNTQRLASALCLLVLFSTVSTAFLASVRASSQATVTIGDSYYSPQEVTILVGSSVLWQNTGSIAHSATSDTGLWDSGLIQPGGSYLSAPFNKVGVYSYHSSESSQMTGKVVVVPTSAKTLYPENLNGGLVAGFILSMLVAILVIFWLNYPSAQSTAKSKLR